MRNFEDRILKLWQKTIIACLSLFFLISCQPPPNQQNTLELNRQRQTVIHESTFSGLNKPVAPESTLMFILEHPETSERHPNDTAEIGRDTVKYQFSEKTLLALCFDQSIVESHQLMFKDVGGNILIHLQRGNPCAVADLTKGIYQLDLLHSQSPQKNNDAIFIRTGDFPRQNQFQLTQLQNPDDPAPAKPLLLTASRSCPACIIGSFNPFATITSLKGADFSNATIPYFILANRDLSWANLQGAILDNAQLMNTNIFHANFSHATLRNADLQHTSTTPTRQPDYLPSKAQFPIPTVDFRDADLNQAILSFSSLREASFAGANLQSVQMKEADLAALDFTGANLTEAILTKANLKQARLTNATLDRTSLQGAQLHNLDFSFLNLSSLDLREANLSGADLSGVNLEGKNLEGINLSGAILVNANLKNADLSGAQLVGTQLSGSQLDGCNLLDALLTNADLTGANLQQASLKNTRLSGANLTAANLTEADLFDAILKGSNWNGANLTALKNLTPEQINTSQSLKEAAIAANILPVPPAPRPPSYHCTVDYQATTDAPDNRISQLNCTPLND